MTKIEELKMQMKMAMDRANETIESVEAMNKELIDRVGMFQTSIDEAKEWKAKYEQMVIKNDMLEGRIERIRTIVNEIEANMIGKRLAEVKLIDSEPVIDQTSTASKPIPNSELTGEERSEAFFKKHNIGGKFNA